jgi:hypothetical protein
MFYLLAARTTIPQLVLFKAVSANPAALLASSRMLLLPCSHNTNHSSARCGPGLHKVWWMCELGLQVYLVALCAVASSSLHAV